MLASNLESSCLRFLSHQQFTGVNCHAKFRGFSRLTTSVGLSSRGHTVFWLNYLPLRCVAQYLPNTICVEGFQKETCSLTKASDTLQLASEGPLLNIILYFVVI